MTKEQKKKIAELRSAGFGYGQIANALGLTKNQVVSYCHRNDLTSQQITKSSSEKINVSYCKNCGKPIILRSLFTLREKKTILSNLLA